MPAILAALAAQIPYLPPLIVLFAVAWLLSPVRAVLPAILQKTDGRGWLAVGCFALVILVLILVAVDATLRKDDLFKMLAQGLVLTAFIGLVLSFFFTASKRDGAQLAAPPIVHASPPDPDTAPAPAPAKPPRAAGSKAPSK